MYSFTAFAGAAYFAGLVIILGTAIAGKCRKETE